MGSLPQTLVNGIALKDDELSEMEIQDSIVHQIMQQTPAFQKAVYHVRLTSHKTKCYAFRVYLHSCLELQGELGDSMNVVDWIMTQENVVTRLNSRVLAGEKTYLDTSEFAGA